MQRAMNTHISRTSLEGIPGDYFKDNPDWQKAFSKENPLANSASYTVFLEQVLMNRKLL